MEAGVHPPARPEGDEPHRTELQGLPDSPGESALASYFASLIDLGLTWSDVAWLRSITRLPLVVKGIVRPDDAVLAVEAGAAAIIVSNHGGRQLDTAPATIRMLSSIASAVAGRAEVLVDGGIRRGTDVVKALALARRARRQARPVGAAPSRQLRGAPARLLMGHAGSGGEDRLR